MSKKPIKKEPDPIVPHDWNEEPVLRGYLISEGPEFAEFKTEEGELVNVQKSEYLISALNQTVNGVQVRRFKGLIEIEYLGEHEIAGGETIERYRVSVES